jgi:hypothetical protein
MGKTVGSGEEDPTRKRAEARADGRDSTSEQKGRGWVVVEGEGGGSYRKISCGSVG